ncbi:MAG: 50S ribosomal protein L22 [Acidobacteria bacterium]|nr:50S ribosomal protein L22 [Acidobacteriota bacterium]MCA1638584.1 50S ribosomal protein L22 [Acidobacteriota bacterium]
MEAIAKTRHLKGSPRKARLVIDLIRGRNVSQALAILRFTNKRAADPIAKCLRSAVANATYLAEQQNIAIDPEGLWVKTCFVDMGVHKNRRRMRPAPQGRAFREQRHYCHLTILVSSDEMTQKNKKNLKAKTRNADGGKTEVVETKAPTKTKTTKKAKNVGEVTEKKSKRAKQETSQSEIKETKKVKVTKPKVEETSDVETVKTETLKADKPAKSETKKAKDSAESGDILETESPKATKASKAVEKEDKKGTAEASDVKDVKSQTTAERHETKQADERQLDENDILERQ